MTVSDNTIGAESLGDFFKSLGKKGLNASKKWQTSYWKIREQLWKLEQTLLRHLHFEALGQLYLTCQK